MSWGKVNAGGSVTSKLPNFTYTGTYTLLDDGLGNWRIKFLASGTLTVTSGDVSVDAFLVGAGAKGNDTTWLHYGYYVGGEGGAGAGANAVTRSGIILQNNTEYDIVIGASSAGTSIAFAFSARGGGGGPAVYEFGGTSGDQYGGDGGSMTGVPGGANTGDGGGGGVASGQTTHAGAAGGSGIVIIRNHREDI